MRKPNVLTFALAVAAALTAVAPLAFAASPVTVAPAAGDPFVHPQPEGMPGGTASGPVPDAGRAA
ncbi:hypothetical protein [Streptomyces sp. NPDC016845]|uniref:hypothetical protein n=1 Tax=Streptomyces sp. NPDC016845 TaxID=3364972 RepID=UPI0037A89DE4